MRRVRDKWGNRRVEDLAGDILAIEEWVNGFHTLGTPDRVIRDRIAKGTLIPGKTIPGQPPRPASKKTKLHVKAFVRLLFDYAMKWKLLNLQR